MAKTLLCACGRSVTAETGEDLLSEVEAHLVCHHRELVDRTEARLGDAPEDGRAGAPPVAAS